MGLLIFTMIKMFSRYESFFFKTNFAKGWHEEISCRNVLTCSCFFLDQRFVFRARSIMKWLKVKSCSLIIRIHSFLIFHAWTLVSDVFLSRKSCFPRALYIFVSCLDHYNLIVGSILSLLFKIVLYEFFMSDKAINFLKLEILKSRTS